MYIFVKIIKTYKFSLKDYSWLTGADPLNYHKGVLPGPWTPLIKRRRKDSVDMILDKL